MHLHVLREIVGLVERFTAFFAWEAGDGGGCVDVRMRYEYVRMLDIVPSPIVAFYEVLQTKTISDQLRLRGAAILDE